MVESVTDYSLHVNLPGLTIDFVSAEAEFLRRGWISTSFGGTLYRADKCLVARKIVLPSSGQIISSQRAVGFQCCFLYETMGRTNFLYEAHHSKTMSHTRFVLSEDEGFVRLQFPACLRSSTSKQRRVKVARGLRLDIYAKAGQPRNRAISVVC